MTMCYKSEKGRKAEEWTKNFWFFQFFGYFDHGQDKLEHYFDEWTIRLRETDTSKCKIDSKRSKQDRKLKFIHFLGKTTMGNLNLSKFLVIIDFYL